MPSVQRAHDTLRKSGISVLTVSLDGTGERAVKPYRWLWVGAVMVGSVATMPAVWAFADIANGLMAVPNLVSLIALSGVAVAETRHYLWEGNLDQSADVPAA